MELEDRDGDEVLHCLGRRTASERVTGIYPAFDITPPRYVRTVVTDRGRFSPAGPALLLRRGAAGVTELLPVTRIPRTGLPAPRVVVGDPFRAERVAKRLDDPVEVAWAREYRTFRGTWQGVEVVVSSHGVGGPGAICLFQELSDAGVRTMLRLGTAGAMQPGIGDGDLVIAEACVRDDGVTHQLVPPEYPPSPARRRCWR